MGTELDRHVEEMLRESGALMEGHFILTSGLHSARYLQCALLCASPDYCEALAKRLAETVRQSLGGDPCDLVLAPALGGVVIGYELARQLGRQGLFAERDKDGAMALRRGFRLEPGGRALVCEDVITTGGSVLEVAKIVAAAGARVVGYACLFDRSNGLFDPGPPVFSIATLAIPTYPPESCPLCAKGKIEAVKPGSRK